MHVVLKVLILITHLEALNILDDYYLCMYYIISLLWQITAVRQTLSYLTFMTNTLQLYN